MGNKLAAIIHQKMHFLSSNPAEFLNKERPAGQKNTFGPLQSTVEWVLADGYKFLRVIGFGAVGCCLLVAFICFGVLKDSQEIKENKKWIVRLLISAGGISFVIGLIGIFAGIGANIDASSASATPTAVPTK